MNKKNKEESGDCSMSFPLCVFPQKVRDIITDLNSERNYPVDYVGGAILFVFSVLIGGYMRLKTSMGVIMANIFVAIIGPQGSHKSQPLMWATNFLQRIDIAALNEYDAQMAEYRRLPAEEQRNTPPPSKPPRLIINDCTPEAIYEIVSKNPSGVGHYIDELSKVFGDLGGRYRSQSDEEMLLSLYSGSPYLIDRKTDERVIRCEQPYYSLAGTTQNETYARLFSKDRLSNGMFARFLTVAHFDLGPLKWPLIEDMPSDADDRFQHIVDKMYGLRDMSITSPVTYNLTSDASTAIVLWQNEWEDHLASSSPDIELAVFRKLQIYALKFALILQVVWDVCEGRDNSKKEIGLDVATYACMVTDYFFECARELVAPMRRNVLSEKQVKAFDALPTHFGTTEGLRIFDQNGICRSEFYRIMGLIRGILVEQEGRGLYRKLHSARD